MASIKVLETLGSYFTVSGVWLFQDDEVPRGKRVAAGRFSMTVLAYSVTDAVASVAAKINYDIVVHKVEKA